MDMISIDGLHFSYGNTQVLENVTCNIRQGRFAALIGDNGAGKSTLMRLILGELPLGRDNGEIRLMDEDIRTFRRWNQISYVPQNGMAAWRDFPASCEEIVAANLYSQIGRFRFPGKKEKEQVLQALREVGMEDYENRLIGNLSGGQQQRILLARALVSQPGLLLLDEPTSGIDEKNTEEFYRLLTSLNQKRGMTILMVTHDRRRLSGMVDDIWLLDDGVARYLNPKKKKIAPAGHTAFTGNRFSRQPSVPADSSDRKKSGKAKSSEKPARATNPEKEEAPLGNL